VRRSTWLLRAVSSGRARGAEQLEAARVAIA
jgi:hypothetical protein